MLNYHPGLFFYCDSDNDIMEDPRDFELIQ